MNTNIAYRRDLLKRRIEAYFKSCDERIAAREMMTRLAAHSHAWIFGGMIRDIGLYGTKGFSSDIDVVVNSNRNELLCSLRHVAIDDYCFNKYGGVRFRYQNIDFDIWCLKDTWAFRENLIPLESEESLFKTTLMSWDAVLYGLHNRTLISPENYLDELQQKRLELVLGYTPNETGALIRVLRTIYGKQVGIIGPRLGAYLQSQLSRYNDEALIHYEHTHYAIRVINGLRLEKLRQRLTSFDAYTDLCLDFQQPLQQLPLGLTSL
ncbi:TPA: hypothetical protein PL523_000956 [Cronobacter turicensis]|nr:hypothetical protein [Cronobacter turicensis]HDI3020502.1 hypothetical protein [Cronobacter turicensis]